MIVKQHQLLKRRLNLALAWNDMNEAALAKQLGISHQAFGQMRDGKYPAINRWQHIAIILQVDAEWLMTGHGLLPIWLAKNPSENTDKKREPPTENSDEKRLISAIITLQAVIAVIRTTIERRKG